MIETKGKSLHSLLKKGIEQAKSTLTSQLVSLTEKIEEHDPVLLFEQAKQLQKDRSFWKSGTEEFYLVTIGSVYEISSDNDQRYKQTYKEWNDLRTKAIIDNPYEQEGTGLIITGGMSFDPKRKRTELWRKYPHSEFVVPMFTLTKHHKECYLTTTVSVTSEDHADQLMEKITVQQTILLTAESTMPRATKIDTKQEVMPNEWKESVQKAIDEIQANKAEKIVMARELRIQLQQKAEITPVIDQLLELQQTSYVFAFERGDHCFIGATPERLVKVSGQALLSTCLAGTAPRGKTPEEDRKLKEQLFADQKNREEHDQVVQMIRRSISDHCTFLDIPSEPTVVTLKNLQHLYTPVIGELKDNYTVFDVIQQLHPTPALGGTPTKDALAFIRNHELFDRGWYGAPVGWLDDRHHGEFAVAIRSGLIQNDEVSLFAGCGVMGDSDIQLEYEETGIKFLPMLTALEENDDTR